MCFVLDYNFYFGEFRYRVSGWGGEIRTQNVPKMSIKFYVSEIILLLCLYLDIFI